MSENETNAAAEEAVEETKAEASEIRAEETVEAKAEATEPSAEEAIEATAEATEPKAEETVEAKEEVADPEEISYHAVEKEGEITAIWEMQGKKHLRTISSRSNEGQKILSLFTSEIHETDSPGMAEQAEATEEASA